MADKNQNSTTTKRQRVIIAVVLAVAVVVAMIGVIGFNSGATESEPDATTEAVAPGTGPSRTAENSPTPTETNNSPSPTKPPALSADGHEQGPSLGDWQPVAEQFATNWANPDGGKDAWLKRLRPLTNDKAYNGLKRTGESAILDLEFVSLDTQFSDDSTAVTDATYSRSDQPVLRIGLAPTNTGEWQVVYVTEPS